jgi:hypothetical protein
MERERNKLVLNERIYMLCSNCNMALDRMIYEASKEIKTKFIEERNGEGF